MRKNLHRFLICQKIFQMVQDENANALFRIGYFVEAFAQIVNDRA